MNDLKDLREKARDLCERLCALLRQGGTLAKERDELAAAAKFASTKVAVGDVTYEPLVATLCTMRVLTMRKPPFDRINMGLVSLALAQGYDVYLRAHVDRQTGKIDEGSSVYRFEKAVFISTTCPFKNGTRSIESLTACFAHEVGHIAMFVAEDEPEEFSVEWWRTSVRREEQAWAWARRHVESDPDWLLFKGIFEEEEARHLECYQDGLSKAIAKSKQP